MGDDEAFRSELRVTFDGSAPDNQEPGPVVTAAASSELAGLMRELTRRVVEPVVASLFSPGEVQNLAVHCRGDDIVLILDALDECSFTLLVADVSTDSDDVDFVAVAEHLAHSLEDFVCETRLGWGQQRVAVYTVPD